MVSDYESNGSADRDQEQNQRGNKVSEFWFHCSIYLFLVEVTNLISEK